jgi:hypothetical protein
LRQIAVMRRISWGTLFLLALLGALVFLFVGYRVAQPQAGARRAIVHEIRQMIATLQAPLEAQPGPAGEVSHGLRLPLPAAVAALTVLLLCVLGLRLTVQQRSRSRRS